MPEKLPKAGDREGQTLEFKRADALRKRDDRRQILRSIVGMLNMRHRGSGMIWVGVAERDECCERLDPFTEEERTLIGSLRDAIIDSIEPTPVLSLESRSATTPDIMMEPVDVPSGGWILRIEAQPRSKSQAPSCLRSGQQREFLIRVDSRTVLMSHEDLFDRGTVTGQEDEDAAHRRKITDSHLGWVHAHKGVPGLALSLYPLPEETAPDDPLKSWLELLRSPPEDLARTNGWTWFAGADSAQCKRGVITSGIVDPVKSTVWRHLTIDPSGRLDFFTDLESLTWQPQTSAAAGELFPDHRGQIGPLCLVETVASVTRLAVHLLASASSRRGRGARVAAIASLNGAQGWLLPLGPPGRFSMFLRDRGQWVRFDQPQVASRVQLRLRSELTGHAEADRLAYALLRDFYEADPKTAEIEPGAIPWFTSEREFVPRS